MPYKKMILHVLENTDSENGIEKEDVYKLMVSTFEMKDTKSTMQWFTKAYDLLKSEGTIMEVTDTDGDDSDGSDGSNSDNSDDNIVKRRKKAIAYFKISGILPTPLDYF